MSFISVSTLRCVCERPLALFLQEKHFCHSFALCVKFTSPNDQFSHCLCPILTTPTAANSSTLDVSSETCGAEPDRLESANKALRQFKSTLRCYTGVGLIRAKDILSFVYKVTRSIPNEDSLEQPERSEDS